MADDAHFDAIVDRYATLLRAEAESNGPVAVLDASTARLEVVRASDADAVLPYEPAPARSYFAAMTVRVDDLAAARRFADDAEIDTRSTGGGFFVSARTARAGLFFTAL